MNTAKKLILLFVLFIFNNVYGNQSDSKIIVDLQNVPLSDALHFLAKALHHNIVISSNVNGNVTLHLQHLSNEEAFNLLLISQNLTKQNLGRTWFILPRLEMVARQESDLKFQTTLEETSPLLLHVWQIHYAKAEEIAGILQDNTNSLLTKRGHVRVDKRTNILCVHDIKTHLAIINELIKKLDVPVQQILIETRLASIDNDYERELGINFAITDCLASSSQSNSLAKGYSLAVARLANGTQLDVQLAALENEGHGELISKPSLFTENQQPASIESGEEIPYQEISRSGATGVAFKKAVLSLKVIPQIMPDHHVLLRLQINQDRPSNRVVLGVPAITTRQINTNVLVANGETIVLGGIYESNHEHAEQRVPFIGKIPLVGCLFKQQNVTENKRELLIFVTPKIIPQMVK